MADQPFEHSDGRTDIERRQNAQRRTDQRADHADHRALHHENRHDLPGCSTQRAQNGDIAFLVVDHHHQRGNDVERSDGDNQQQQQADHGFFHADGLIEVAVGTRPVTGIEIVFAQLLRDFP